MHYVISFYLPIMNLKMDFCDFLLFIFSRDLFGIKDKSLVIVDKSKFFA